MFQCRAHKELQRIAVESQKALRIQRQACSLYCNKRPFSQCVNSAVHTMKSAFHRLKLLAPELFFFLILAHSVYKM